MAIERKDEGENTQYTHSTFLSAQKCMDLKLKAKNVCFGFYAMNMCKKCKYADTKCFHL